MSARIPAAAPVVENSTASLLPLLQQVVRALDDKKASDLRVLRVTEQSSITDYLVLATGNAEPHLRALRVELEKVLDAAGAKIAGMETGDGSGWLVVDAYQIMIHIFLPSQRDNYRLEQLWQDAEQLEVEAILNPATPAKAKVKKSVGAPKKKTTAARKKIAPVKKAAPAKKKPAATAKKKTK